MLAGLGGASLVEAGALEALLCGMQEALEQRDDQAVEDACDAVAAVAPAGTHLGYALRGADAGVPFRLGASCECSYRRACTALRSRCDRRQCVFRDRSVSSRQRVLFGWYVFTRAAGSDGAALQCPTLPWSC